jgi:hypothetical protein
VEREDESILVRRGKNGLSIEWDDGYRTLFQGTDEQAHTWLCDRGYKRVGKAANGDPICGLYVRAGVSRAA